MNLKVLFLISVIALITLTSVDAWRRRRFRIRIRVRGRRIWRKLCPLACSIGCKKACAACSPVCSPVCGRICRGKREAKKEYEDGTFMKPFPCNFSTYDSNDDKSINPAELGRVTNESGNEDDVKQLFKEMDVNGDGVVDQEEFDVAPLVKNCKGKDKSETEPEERDLDKGDDIDEEGE